MSDIPEETLLATQQMVELLRHVLDRHSQTSQLIPADTLDPGIELTECNAFGCPRQPRHVARDTDDERATDYMWQWGQFLDHDIVETPTIDRSEPFDIPVPGGDIWFDPTGTGTQAISLNRSFYEEHHGVREQVNGITSFIDASNVYGSDSVRAYALRKLDGSGELKTTSSDHGDLLPYNATRRALGMPPARNFRDVTPDREVQQKLSSVYDTVEDIDPYPNPGIREIARADVVERSATGPEGFYDRLTKRARIPHYPFTPPPEIPAIPHLPLETTNPHGILHPPRDQRP